MNWVKIQWEFWKYSELDLAEHAPLYMFATDLYPHYIGLSYAQHVYNEIHNTFRRLQIQPKSKKIWIGDIIDSSYSRITSSIVKDTEALLIYKHLPKLNIQNTVNYNGRINFEVISLGGSPLKKKIKI